MIIFLDDQIESADLYLDEFEERGLDFKYFQSADDAWSFLEGGQRKPSVAVIDIMMPNGELFSAAETSDGLTTGVRFYKIIREKFPTCYVIALTNLSSPIIKETLGPDRLAMIYRKDEIYYDELADEVERIVRRD